MNVKTSRNTSGRNSGFLTVSCEWTDLEENNSLLRFWKCLHLARRISLWAYIAVSPCPTRNKTSAVSWSSIRCWKSRKSVSTPSQVLSLAWKESMFAFANREKRQARTRFPGLPIGMQCVQMSRTSSIFASHASQNWFRNIFYLKSIAVLFSFLCPKII